MGSDQATLQKFDAVIIATNHQVVNYNELGEWSRCIVDTRNAMANITTDGGRVWKA